MTATAVGLVVAALSLLAAFVGPRASAAVLGATLPLSAAAAAILPFGGGATVLCSAIAAAGFALSVGLRALRARLVISPATGFLIAFVAVAVVGAYAFPRIFAGETLVYALDRRVIGVTDGAFVFPLSPLAPVAGGLTQSLYLISSLIVFLAAAYFGRRDPKMIGALLWAATASQIVFAAADVAGARWLDHFRTATYQIAPAQGIAGFTRVIGGATEPAFFGGLSAALAAWHLWSWRARGGAHGIAALLMAGLVAASLSTTAWLVLFAVLALFVCLALISARNLGVLAMAWIGGAACLVALAWVMMGPLGEAAATGLDAVIFDKLDSASGRERSAWAAQALVNFTETLGFGAGLGATRASGWGAAVLGQVGLPGALLAIAFLVSAFAPRGEAPLRAAALALLGAALLSASRVDLGYFFFATAGAYVASAGERRAILQMKGQHATASL